MNLIKKVLNIFLRPFPPPHPDQAVEQAQLANMPLDIKQIESAKIKSRIGLFLFVVSSLYQAFIIVTFIFNFKIPFADKYLLYHSQWYDITAFIIMLISMAVFTIYHFKAQGSSTESRGKLTALALVPTITLIIFISWIIVYAIYFSYFSLAFRA